MATNKTALSIEQALRNFELIAENADDPDYVREVCREVIERGIITTTEPPTAAH
jgi:hypothetical protein